MKLPLNPFKAILKEKGADRVSKEAMKELRKMTELYAYSVADIAVACAEHASRVTVLADDVRLAIR